MPELEPLPELPMELEEELELELELLDPEPLPASEPVPVSIPASEPELVLLLVLVAELVPVPVLLPGRMTTPVPEPVPVVVQEPFIMACERNVEQLAESPARTSIWQAVWFVPVRLVQHMPRVVHPGPLETVPLSVPSATFEVAQASAAIPSANPLIAPTAHFIFTSVIPVDPFGYYFGVQPRLTLGRAV